jgi:hypothetical protein
VIRERIAHENGHGLVATTGLVIVPAASIAIPSDNISGAIVARGILISASCAEIVGSEVSLTICCASGILPTDEIDNGENH